MIWLPASLKASWMRPLSSDRMALRCPGCDTQVLANLEVMFTAVACDRCGSKLEFAQSARTDFFSTGTVIGHYVLVEKLGAGSFGCVWKANDTTLDRTVALKIPNRVAGSLADSERFLREARAAAQTQHPNIVPRTDRTPLP